MDWKEFLELSITLGKYRFALMDLLAAITVFLGAKALVWLVHGVWIERFFRGKKFNEGRKIALKQVATYLIFLMAIFTVVELLHISSAILAGSAALLVGIGLGLQETFKSLVSGIVILLEGNLEVGDVIEVDGMVAVVKRIGLRTSVVETREHVSILIPNTKFVNEKVINWSHDQEAAAFSVSVGVAYEEDPALVSRLLVEAALAHPLVLATPLPQVDLAHFANKSLDFNLSFYSNEFFGSDKVQSEIRLNIIRLFREHEVEFAGALI